MPAKYLMSWEQGVRRWCKMYKRQRHAVTCKQLSEWAGRHLQPTKEGSYQAANEWWRQKQLEIDGGGSLTPEVAEARRKAEWCWANDRPEEAEFWEATAADVARIPPKWAAKFANVVYRTSAIMRAEGRLVDSGLSRKAAERVMTNPVVADQMTEEQAWAERLGESPEPEYTLERSIKAYLSLRDAERRAGLLSDRTHKATTAHLDALLRFLGGTYDVRKIDEQAWQRYYTHLISSDWSAGYRRNLQVSAKLYVQWLAETKVIALPANLLSRSVKIGKGGARKIETLAIEVCRRLIAETPDHIKIGVLLAVNCGFLAVDISELSHDEVDWKQGRILRRRTKERDAENVPVVDYKLWPETFDLLRKMRSDDPRRVLLTPDGTPWVTYRYEEGKFRGTDNFAGAWVQLKKKMGPEIRCPKLVRKTSSSKLGENAEFSRYAQYFLGQAPDTVADRHYVQPSKEQFDRAIDWLHDQYFG